MTLFSVKKAFNVALATSLVHLYPPKHHTRALRILDEVLSEDPNNVELPYGSWLRLTARWEVV
jgi:superkiller protein 3